MTQDDIKTFPTATTLRQHVPDTIVDEFDHKLHQVLHNVLLFAFLIGVNDAIINGNYNIIQVSALWVDVQVEYS